MDRREKEAMNNKRRYPLFIIDSSRSHGRGSETDYISCTSNELPFVAAVTLHKESEYAELYNPSNVTDVWSEPHGGIRMRIKVVSELPDGYDKGTLCGLLRRALKEMLIRRVTQYVNINNITDDNVIKWCTVLRQQVTEHLRENPEDNQQKMNLAIITKILSDYINYEARDDR